MALDVVNRAVASAAGIPSPVRTTRPSGLRLLYLNHNYGGSGTFHRAYQLGREMVRRGHGVTVVTTSRSARLRTTSTVRDGVRVLEAPDLFWGAARTGWDPYNTARRMRLLDGESFDIVHAFDSRPVVIFPALARARAGAVLVMDWADWWGRGGTIEERSGWFVRTLFGPVETWFEEAFRARAAGATVISSALHDRCCALGVPQERILRLPHGCNPTEWTCAAREEARRRLGLDSGPLLVHLGTALPGDAALMFDALRRARASEPRLRLVLVGGFRGRVPPDLTARNAVRATGLVSADALRLWLSSADACVVTLRDTVASRGRWPSKVNDYLAAGRAIVMTDVGDVSEYVRDGGAGLVCAPDREAVAAAMVRIVRDAPLRETAERNASKLAADRLAWSGLAAKLDGFYAEVLHRHGTATGATVG